MGRRPQPLHPRRILNFVLHRRLVAIRNSTHRRLTVPGACARVPISVSHGIDKRAVGIVMRGVVRIARKRQRGIPFPL
jgi:hypothetical protein